MQELSGRGLRRALIAGIQRVISRRDELNRINVFPVPDGDTGTNLAFTLGAVLTAINERRSPHAGEVMRHAASEALDGARGNSGAIVAQFFQGVAERIDGSARLTPALLADAADVGSRLAREALAEPREGTILSVISAFAAEWKRAIAEGTRDFRGSFERALVRARKSLKDTPQQLAVLKSAGVVDAGGAGFVDLLEGIDAYIRDGRSALRATAPAELSVNGVTLDHAHGADQHRYCVECMVSGEPVDRLALKAALLAMPLTSLVLAGTREKVRVHAHLDEPATLFEACGRFGWVSSPKADDMLRQSHSASQPRARTAIVVDSGADVPAEELERLDIHLVPVRVSVGAKDYLDKVSLSPKEFYRELRDSPVHPRTSQPPPGDFRRMFEFLLSHHDEVVYVGLSRALSGTLQAAEAAAGRIGEHTATVVDTFHGAAAQGLIAMDAAEAAANGADAAAIRRRINAMTKRTQLFAAIRDLTYGVRGGRAPKLALPLSKLTGCLPIIRSLPSGKLGFGGLIWGRDRFVERFAAAVARKLDPSKRYRLLIGHCDSADDGAKLRTELLARLPNVTRSWVVEAGSAVGAHAGPGSLMLGVQEELPADTMAA